MAELKSTAINGSLVVNGGDTALNGNAAVSGKTTVGGSFCGDGAGKIIRSSGEQTLRFYRGDSAGTGDAQYSVRASTSTYKIGRLYTISIFIYDSIRTATNWADDCFTTIDLYDYIPNLPKSSTTSSGNILGVTVMPRMVDTNTLYGSYYSNSLAIGVSIQQQCGGTTFTPELDNSSPKVRIGLDLENALRYGGYITIVFGATVDF